MKSKLQKIILCLFLLCCIYNLWTLRPVQMLYTYSDAGNSVFLVVDHLPWTDSDKINWYLKHQNEIKNQHPLPEGSWHTWYVIDIGNGIPGMSLISVMASLTIKNISKGRMKISTVSRQLRAMIIAS